MNLKRQVTFLQVKRVVQTQWNVNLLRRKIVKGDELKRGECFWRLRMTMKVIFLCNTDMSGNQKML